MRAAGLHVLVLEGGVEVEVDMDMTEEVVYCNARRGSNSFLD